MTDEERRISLRVDDDLFRRLRQKAVDQGTTFQDVGVHLLKSWLEGEAPRACVFDDCSPGERKRLERYLFMLRTAKHPEKITALIDVWAEDFARERTP